MAKQFQVDTGGTLLTNLVSYFKLEDATDYYGSNNLTNTGSCAFNPAKVSNGVDSGSSPTNKYLSIASNLGITDNIVSIAAWARMSTAITGGSNGQQWEIFNLGNNTTNNDFRVVYQNNAGVERIGVAKQRGGIAEDFQYSNVTVGTTNFHFVVMTYDASTMKLFYDNAEIISYTPGGNGSSGTNSFGIMKNTVDNIYQFEGLVDEVGVWHKKLTTTEINDLYNGGAGQTMVDVTPNTATLAMGINF